MNTPCFAALSESQKSNFRKSWIFDKNQEIIDHETNPPKNSSNHDILFVGLVWIVLLVRCQDFRFKMCKLSVRFMIWSEDILILKSNLNHVKCKEPVCFHENYSYEQKSLKRKQKERHTKKSKLVSKRMVMKKTGKRLFGTWL